MLKIMSKVAKISSYCLFGLIICLSVFVMVLRFLGETPNVFGYCFYYVLTESMEPEICSGEMIIGRITDPSELQIGDIVTYKGDTGSLSGKVITHKIIEIDGDIFVTQGVANNIPDPAIHGSQILSRYVMTVPFAGKIFSVINSKVGFLLLIITPLMLLIVNEVSIIAKAFKEDKEEHLSE